MITARTLLLLQVYDSTYKIYLVLYLVSDSFFHFIFYFKQDKTLPIPSVSALETTLFLFIEKENGTAAGKRESN